MANPNIAEIIDSLRFGDLVQVDWLDASEATGNMNHNCFDVPICSVGFFLGVKGRKTRHIVIAKEIIDSKTYHYNVIPVRMINRILVHSKVALNQTAKRRLKKLYLKTFRSIKKRGGWLNICSEPLSERP